MSEIKTQRLSDSVAHTFSDSRFKNDEGLSEHAGSPAKGHCRPQCHFASSC